MTEPDPPRSPPPPPQGATVPPPPESGGTAPPAPTFTVAHPRRGGDAESDVERDREPTEVGSRSRGQRRALPFVLCSVVLVVVIVAALALIVRGGSENDAAADAVVSPRSTPETNAQIAATQPQVPATTTASEPVTQPPAVVTATQPATTLPPTTTTLAATTTTVPSTTAPPTPPPDPEVVALQQLQTLIASDAPLVASIAEHWVPQLGAKQLGTVWQGVTYDYQQILAEHRHFRDVYRAVLVDGATYNFRQSGQPMAGWFITLVPQAYSDADGALAWCTAQRIDRENCFAKLLTQNQDAGQTIRLND